MSDILLLSIRLGCQDGTSPKNFQDPTQKENYRQWILCVCESEMTMGQKLSANRRHFQLNF